MSNAFCETQRVVIHYRNFMVDGVCRLYCMDADNAASQLDRLSVGEFTPIFNPDNRRRQRALADDDVLRKMMLHSLANHGMLQARTAGRSVVFQSVPGCTQQDWHYDYDPAIVADLAVKPVSVLLALQDNTALEVWTDMSSTTIPIDAGQMAVVCGDTVHAGAAYDTYNTRVHLYLDTPGVSGGYEHYWTPVNGPGHAS